MTAQTTPRTPLDSMTAARIIHRQIQTGWVVAAGQINRQTRFGLIVAVDRILQTRFGLIVAVDQILQTRFGLIVVDRILQTLLDLAAVGQTSHRSQLDLMVAADRILQTRLDLMVVQSHQHLLGYRKRPSAE